VPTPIKSALHIQRSERLEITDLVLDDPLDDEVVVRTKRVGLCHSDLHYIEGLLGIARNALAGLTQMRAPGTVRVVVSPDGGGV
jgi:S-(hydroxymethyl)glutathione dehydrogenase/alcohol dehydrogenase